MRERVAVKMRKKCEQRQPWLFVYYPYGGQERDHEVEKLVRSHARDAAQKKRPGLPCWNGSGTSLITGERDISFDFHNVSEAVYVGKQLLHSGRIDRYRVTWHEPDDTVPGGENTMPPLWEWSGGKRRSSLHFRAPKQKQVGSVKVDGGKVGLLDLPVTVKDAVYPVFAQYSKDRLLSLFVDFQPCKPSRKRGGKK